MHIDLNCDLGESFGAWRMGDDVALLELVSSANIACGFHAGDPEIMCHTVAQAIAHGVAIGAHVSLPDLQGFGRREMSVTPAEAHAMTLYQIGALHAFTRAAGARLSHVKPHGALYNMAARDPALANAIARAVRATFCKSSRNASTSTALAVARAPGNCPALAASSASTTSFNCAAATGTLPAGSKSALFSFTNVNARANAS